jgi:hypothetical protein
VASLVAKYHDGDAPAGRDHRVIVAIHPTVAPARPTSPASLPMTTEES